MKSFKTLIFASLIALSGLDSAPANSQETAGYTQAELDQMLAPIALYPDTVLSHVLIASTYPLEVVEAARWARNNPGYSGEEAVAMVEGQDWDPSVKALVAFPELLDRMDQDIGWTQSLGDAFLAQEGEVTDTIQYLRNQAYENGQLQSNAQVNVVRETRYIYIEPAQPQVVYVPYYDPRVVYGHWRWADYPPVYWHHPPGFSLSLGFYWGVGYHLQSSFFFSSFYWPSRHVVVVDRHYHDRYPRHGYRKGHRDYRPGYNMAHYDGANRWQHDSQHRRGVNYRSHVNPDRFSNRDDSRRRDRWEPAREGQTRGLQRDWADQQRKRFVDNVARNGGPRARDSAAGRRSAQVSNPQPAAPRSAPRIAQEKSDRPVSPVPAGQRVVERREQNPKRETREVAAAPQRPHQSRRTLAAHREAEPRRQATPPRQAEPKHQVAPPREVASGRQARADRASAERASKPERAAQGQRSEPGQRGHKGERSGRGRDSRKHG